MHPRQSGQGFLPRYGGGWMHQFGHVYALQQELLAADRCNWFRATELWHTARHEGLALNSAHYGNILRQCVHATAWEQSLLVLKQMRRDALRPDVTAVACAMAACADAGKWAEAAAIFGSYEAKMKLDSQCFLALLRACNRAAAHDRALEAGRKQMSERIPFLPEAVGELTAAANVLGTSDACRVALEAADNLEEYSYVSAGDQKVLRALALRHSLPVPRWIDDNELLQLPCDR